MNIWAALGFIALGAAISEIYNRRIWMKYKDGMENGISLRYWKMGVEEDGNPTVTAGRGRTAAGASPRPTSRMKAREMKAVK